MIRGLLEGAFFDILNRFNFGITSMEVLSFLPRTEQRTHIPFLFAENKDLFRAALSFASTFFTDLVEKMKSSSPNPSSNYLDFFISVTASWIFLRSLGAFAYFCLKCCSRKYLESSNKSSNVATGASRGMLLVFLGTSAQLLASTGVLYHIYSRTKTLAVSQNNYSLMKPVGDLSAVGPFSPLLGTALVLLSFALSKLIIQLDAGGFKTGSMLVVSVGIASAAFAHQLTTMEVIALMNVIFLLVVTEQMSKVGRSEQNSFLENDHHEMNERKLNRTSSKAKSGRNHRSLLSYIIEGRGLLRTALECPEDELCTNLSILCLCIENSPIWMKDHQRAAVEILRKRIAGSKRLAQAMALIFASNTIKNAEIFGDIHLDLLEPKLGLSDTLANFFALNEVATRVQHDKTNVRKGMEIEIAGDVFHPFVGARIHWMKVCKIFPTNSKPVLLSFSSSGEQKSSPPPWSSPNVLSKIRSLALFSPAHRLPMVIMKSGDDFRQDVACMSVFKLFNHIWRTLHTKYRGIDIHCHEYETVATGKNLGAIEFVEGCVPMSDIKRIRPILPGKTDRVIASGAGSYIAAFALGIRDRHADNIMMKKDGTIFHIDFGHAMGSKVILDAAEFAVPKSFQKEIGSEAYNEFVTACVDAYRALRNPDSVHMVLTFAQTMFSSLYPSHKVSSFMTKKLMLNEDLNQACAKLKKIVERAPDSYRTRFKNSLHAIVQASKAPVEGLGDLLSRRSQQRRSELED
eukprot:CAMPEP_0184478434 /NCGR_PEP_ID=MMETSP0113_2-20130426/466_1 /TAXON_ID=91329 /ORGANISM="Norrisiella sphaerica, Strain BC52" /LENGTH=742 /DNA_ID=CAMNT_0026856231 /DNA_START=201 /DNA_END=2429 /DNA_ORIENTATION=+